MGNRSSASASTNSSWQSRPSKLVQQVSNRSDYSPPLTTTDTKDFNDDQPLTGVYQKPAGPISTAVPKGDLTVVMKCCCPQVQVSTAKAQEFPCIVSLISPDIEEDKVESERRGMDLVCVVDVSGSMHGEKLALVQATLNFMLSKLTINDRVSLISFQSRPTRVTPLTVCDAVGLSQLTSAINLLHAGGGTNIVSGLHYGLEVLKRRRQSNAVTSLFLLSDGQDDNPGADERAREEINCYGEAVCGAFVTHTFGYGAGHDAVVMSAIAGLRGGCYNFVENTETVAEAFAKCLGGLVSSFANSITVELVPNTDTVIPVVLGKVYGAVGNNTLKVINMLTSDRKDSVFILNFPVSHQNVVTGTPLTPVSAIITYRLVANGEERRQEATLQLSLISETDPEVKIDVDETVLVNFYRVKTAEVLKEAGELSDQGNTESGSELITRFLRELRGSLVANTELVKVLIGDLERSKARMASESDWSHGGQAMYMDLCSNHMMQQASSNVEIYSNRVQSSYKAASKRHP